MRLPFPERISFVPVCIFAVSLCAVQIFQGTNPEFSLCCFLFIIVATAAFNVAGGITRPSGAYIFFFSILTVIIGLVGKAVLNEPADSNLLIPITTAKVYLGTICGMFAAAYVSKRVVPKRALLANFVTEENIQSATVGCMITGFIFAILFTLPRKDGSLLSVLFQLNRFFIMAIFLGVIHTIRRSGGRKSINLPVLISLSFVFLYNGVFSFSKEGMVTPLLSWVLAAASQHYRLSWRQALGVALIAFFVSYYLVPYSQYGRNYRQNSLSANFDTVVSMIGNLDTVRKEFKESEGSDDEGAMHNYFNNHQGFLDRLQMIGPDDSLVNLTEQGVVTGIAPIYVLVAGFVPHFIWKDKPRWEGGNLYARQMGYLAEDDFSTGISFSPASEAFHFMRWNGVFILAPIIYTITFILADSLCGDVRKSPWGFIFIVLFAHVAPEGGIGILVSSMAYAIVAILFTAIVVTYVMPIVGEIIAGPNRRAVRFRDPLKLSRRGIPTNPPEPSAPSTAN